MKRIAIATGLVLAALTLTACDEDATIVNENIDKAAANFEVNRRIVVVNGVTDKYLLTIEGRCDITPKKDRVFVTCKVGKGKEDFKRHQIYKSDNVAVVVEQIDSIKASPYHYRMTFKPQQVVPDIDFRGSTEGPSAQD